MANKGQKWSQKVDSFFNQFYKTRKRAGKKMDKILTILMLASIIILIITVVYVILSNKNGRTAWAIQLQGISIDKLVEAPHEIIVIDYSAEGDAETAFSKVEIARIKASGKRVYAYLSIGEAENYRYYWKDQWDKNPPSWLAEENPDWEGNYLVKYWDKNWQDIIYSGKNNYLDIIQDAGFDGVYLDKVDAYEQWEDKCYKKEQNEEAAPKYCFESIESENEEEPVQISLPRTRMAEFVLALSEEGKKRNTSFQVFIQHGFGILEDERIWDAIAGVGKEELFYTDGQERSEEEINFDIAILDQVVAAEKLVLVVEYISDEEQIDNICTQTQIHGYIPFVSTIDLNTLSEEKVCK